MPATHSDTSTRTLDLPESGPGSAGGLGCRVAAVTIDWFACLAIAAFLNRALAPNGLDPQWTPLLVFFAQATLLTWLQAASFGQRILGLAVVPFARPRLGLLRVALRTFLLCLVIPAVVMQPNGRGLHDLAAGSVVVRRR